MTGNGGYTADETAMGPVYENVAEVKAEADEMPVSVIYLFNSSVDPFFLIL